MRSLLKGLPTIVLLFVLIKSYAQEKIIEDYPTEEPGFYGFEVIKEEEVPIETIYNEIYHLSDLSQNPVLQGTYLSLYAYLND